MKYLVQCSKGDREFEVSYQNLKKDYETYVSMSDESFFNCLTEILHFSCLMSCFKEIPAGVVLSDEGVIHEIAHILSGVGAVEKEVLREKFNKVFYLA